MALSKGLLELIALVTDAEQKKQLQTLVEANEKIFQERFEGHLRQSDYDRQSNELKTKIAAREKELNDWYALTKPKHESLAAEYEKSVADRTRLEADLKAAIDGKGGDVDEATLKVRIEERLKEFGTQYLSKADVTTIVAQETAKLVKELGATERKEFFEKTMPASNEFLLTMQDINFTHRDEFKEPLDRKKLYDHMVAKKIDDPRTGYNDFVADRRTEAEKIRLKAEAKAEFEKEQAAKAGVPGSGVLPSSELGPLQIHLQKKAPGEVPEGVEVGSGALARLAAAELRAENKV